MVVVARVAHHKVLVVMLARHGTQHGGIDGNHTRHDCVVGFIIKILVFYQLILFVCQIFFLCKQLGLIFGKQLGLILDHACLCGKLLEQARAFLLFSALCRNRGKLSHERVDIIFGYGTTKVGTAGAANELVIRVYSNLSNRLDEVGRAQFHTPLQHYGLCGTVRLLSAE